MRPNQQSIILRRMPPNPYRQNGSAYSLAALELAKLLFLSKGEGHLGHFGRLIDEPRKIFAPVGALRIKRSFVLF
jgi:hypothetical protein